MDQGVKTKQWVSFKTKSGAAVVTYRTDKPWDVEIALYKTVNGEVAMGITNHTLSPIGTDLFAIFLEIDNHDRTAEDIIRGLLDAGFMPWLVARTNRGWHVILRDFVEDKETVVKAMRRLAESNLCDPGFVELAEIRLRDQEAHFTNLLRVHGKYAERDIVVKRVTPPPTEWHKHVWDLYRRYAKVEVSATRYAAGCLGYTPKPTMEMWLGKEEHRLWEERMQKEGWEVEKEFTHEVGNTVYTGVVDAIKELENEVQVIEYKSTANAALEPTAQHQAEFYANLIAIIKGKPTVVRVIHGDETVWEVRADPATAKLPDPETLRPGRKLCSRCVLYRCWASHAIIFDPL